MSAHRLSAWAVMWHGVGHAIGIALRSAIAAVLCLAAIWATEDIIKMARGWRHPVAEWFEPRVIEVPTPQTISGHMYLFYGRQVWKPFDGTYRVSVVPVDGNDTPKCDDDYQLVHSLDGLPPALVPRANPHVAKTDMLPPPPAGSKSHAEDHDYIPRSNSSPLIVVELSDFIGTNWCRWRPGKYYLLVSWVVRRRGYFDEIVGPLTSNVFELIASGAEYGGYR